jgi:hypothetical protein
MHNTPPNPPDHISPKRLDKNVGSTAKQVRHDRKKRPECHGHIYVWCRRQPGMSEIVAIFTGITVH